MTIVSGPIDSDRANTSCCSFDECVDHRLAPLSILVDEVDENDCVRNDDADKHEQTDERGNAEWNSRDDLKSDCTGRGERNRYEQEQWLTQASEGRDHDDVHDENGGEQRESELQERVRLVLGDTANGDGSSRGERDSVECLLDGRRCC